MNQAKRILCFLFLLCLLTTCVDLKRYLCSGSYCTTLNYEFGVGGKELINRIQQVKKRDPQWDILEKKDSMYCTMDSCWSNHINHYSLRIFNRIDTCVIFCDINLGVDSPPNAKFNMIAITSYYFPKIGKSSSDCTYSDGKGEFFWEATNPIRVNAWEPNEMQGKAQNSAEAFFKLIGAYKIID